VGPEGQAKLKAARVLIVGAGGLGSPAALMLAAAGVGRIGIAEFDRLEASNLHRQVLYDADGVGEKKAVLAAARLRALNPFIEVEIHDARVDAARVPGLFAGYDVVLDCTDNFPTKYLLGDAAVLFGVPVVQASIHRFEGQMLTIDPKSEGGCLRCLWREPPPEGAVGNCAEVGVLGVVPGLFGTMQAAEALKLILGLPGTLDSHLLIMDALSFETRRIARRRDAECPLCGEHPSITALPQAANDAVELDAAELTSEALADFRIVDLREPEERVEAPLPDTIMACAVQLPFSRFDAAALPFDDSRKVLFVCSRGGRSLKAATELRARGWREVYSLVGGASRLTPLLLQAAE
jgi:adenylyltransferase/sulfurtransferase